MKAVVVGRHNGQIPGIEVVEQVSLQYPADADETERIVSRLFEEVYCKHFLDAGKVEIPAVVFQDCPAQLAVALHRLIKSGNFRVDRIGFVVSVPDERPAGITKEFGTDDPYAPATMRDLVAHCNPTAKVEVESWGVKVTVDRPMAFKFSHIEWLTGRGK